MNNASTINSALQQTHTKNAAEVDVGWLMSSTYSRNNK